MPALLDNHYRFPSHALWIQLRIAIPNTDCPNELPPALRGIPIDTTLRYSLKEIEEQFVL